MTRGWWPSSYTPLETLSTCLPMHQGWQTKIYTNKNRGHIKKTLCFVTYHSEVAKNGVDPTVMRLSELLSLAPASMKVELPDSLYTIITFLFQ